MIGNERNFSLSLWDHKDNFICLLKASNSNFIGQSYNENLTESITGEKTLSFSIPMYIFNPDIEVDNKYEQNIRWNYIFNEQKIRYTEYDKILNTPVKIEEFVLKEFTEDHNGYEKVVNCVCESLAIYELGKVGWSIKFDTDYITQYEIENNPEDFLQLNYWLKKIFYKETNLGRVSTTTECTYLLQGLQLRNNDGTPIASAYKINTDGSNSFSTISEPIATSKDLTNYINNTGWYWEIEAIDPRRPDEDIFTNILYEEPVVDRYIEVVPDYYSAFSYQKRIGANDSTKELLPYPIPKEKYGQLQYITDVKKRLITCERSNIFSIIQDLCEAFEVWAYFNYEYNEQGKIIGRKILFKTEAVNDKIVFDFSYGKNLQSCSRVIDSNELITKLIVPDTESNLDSDKILSIKQATANPTEEGYLYNFDYFYNCGMLSTIDQFRQNRKNITQSDEYKINLHCGKLKNYNTRITNLQKYLVPLYTRQMELEGDLSVQQASLTGLMDNIQSIQDKIDAIPSDQQVINSWSDDKTQYNYIGELKTISTTVDGNATKYYINFGREDVIFNTNISVTTYTLNVNNELIENSVIPVASYIPRYYTNATWTTGTNVDDDDYTILEITNNTSIVDHVDISYIGDKPTGYIKGIYLSEYPGRSYIRIRYKYAPLSYYYMLIKDYWDKILEVRKKVNELKNNLQEINNKIIVNELSLNNILKEKNELILQFEKEYKPFIREGYWEASDYQSQIDSEQLDTNNKQSIYEGIISITNKLSDLNLNNSLSTYSYYINLNRNIADINVDSIEMTTINPAAGSGNTSIPRYRGNDFEIYTDVKNNNVILGISPSLIDTYKSHDYKTEDYKSKVLYTLKNNNIINTTYDWIEITDESNSPEVYDRFIYLSNDNLLTDSLSVYGNSVTTDNLLQPYVDYTYSFDYAGYNDNGIRVDLSKQSTYSENIHYDYITKISLKNTNKSNSYNRFIVNYNKETTLQFLYNDAVATSKKYSNPQITYNISVLDLSSLNGYEHYKPVLGQKVPIFDPEMHFNGYEGIITSVEKQLESPENVQITIATYQTKFEDIFQKLTATMTDVQYNQNSLYNAASSFDNNNTGVIKTEVFQKSLENNNFQIQLGTNNDITIDKQSGITLVDQDNKNAVKLIGNGIFLTNNYIGNTSQWVTGITGEGINANTLVTGNIDTKNINIWNASEGQIRFIWNEQGLFAYGATGVGGQSTSTAKDFIDYKKFVKFNYEGLQFSDNGKSALTLGWNGLSIDTQNGALRLDADNGLILKNGNITRLELGKLNNGTIYGLKLYDTSGNPSFQSDSDGNLWLSKYIKIGGTFNGSTYTKAPTAGIIGVDSGDIHNQMGIMRDTSTGNINWNNKTLRFWAGRQTKSQYLSNLSMTNSDVASISQWNNINDYDPALARFKVDEDGNIVASGIDVGGWIGAGKILRSKNYEAILRSDDYNNEYPVLAIGNPSNDNTGKTHNFRVYQNGSINITKNNTTSKNKFYTGIISPSSSTDVVFYTGTKAEPNDAEFRVLANGSVTATKLSIGQSQVSGLAGELTSISNTITQITNGAIQIAKIGGYTNNTNSLTAGKTNYFVGIRAPSSATDIVYYAGTDNSTLTNNAFYVQANGAVKASNITISGGNNTNNLINANGNFIVKNNGAVTASNITITGISGNTGNLINASNFKVTQNGNVTANNITFNGTITANYDKLDYTGINAKIATVTVDGVTKTYRVVRGLIVGREN